MTTLVTKLEAKIRKHQALYDAGTPEIPDAEFDMLVERLRKLSPDSPVLEELGTPGSTAHSTPMLSLQKFYEIGAVRRWAEKTGDTLFVLQPKYDGVALSLIYDAAGRLERAMTRGDGQQGEDVTERARLCPSIPRRLTEGRRAEVRGELIMSEEAFEAHYKGKAANARNLVAGLLMRKTGKEKALRRCMFFAYDLGRELAHKLRIDALQMLGFSTAATATSVLPTIDHALRSFEAYVKNVGFATDGIVIKCDDAEITRKLGATSHHPRWACALKFRGVTIETGILDVTWQVSRTGTLTPVVELEPVHLDGVTISRATLHHYGRFTMLAPAKGDTAIIARRGGVIPHVEAVREQAAPAAPLSAPTHCPSCRSALKVDGDFLRCPAPDCASAEVRRLLHWCRATDMEGWGPEVVQLVYDAGLVTTPADLYSVEEGDLECLPGLGLASAGALVSELERTRDLPLATFVAALGIPTIGPTVAKRIAKAITSFENFIEIEELADVLENVHGVGKARVRALTDWISENEVLLFDLRVALTVAPHKHTSAQGPLAGKKFVFTGKLSDMERGEAQRAVQKCGAETPSSVTKDTDYLVVGDAARDDQLTKRNKAAKYGVKIIDEAKFVEILHAATEAL